MPLDKWLARAKANKQLCHCESCLLVVAGEYAAIEVETLERAALICDEYGLLAKEEEFTGGCRCCSCVELRRVAGLVSEAAMKIRAQNPEGAA